MMLSVVIPVYKNERSLTDLTNTILLQLSKIDAGHEIILVEDSSPDNSWKVIEMLAAQHKSVKGLKLSRNFGQHPAIIAGLTQTKGDWIVVMDADFQDDPSYIPLLLERALEGFDLVFARRKERTDSFFKRALGSLFYKFFSYLTDSTFDGSIGNFGIYNRNVINAVLDMKEPFKVFSLMARWVGFHADYLDVIHGTRREGKSSYTLKKLVDLGLTIILTYSQKPLRLTVRLGLLMSGLSFLFVAYNIFAYFTGIIQVVGYASLIASIWLIGGLIIFFIGILGLYIGKILESTKNRPSFIFSKKLNIE